MDTLVTDYKLNTIGVIGSHLPRRCGIATFTTDLCEALTEEIAGDCRVAALAMDDVDTSYDYPDRVRFKVRANVQADYLRAAEFLNVNRFDVVLLQHEYGIYGGPTGAHILRLVRALNMPVLTTLHTVLIEPGAAQREIMLELADNSERLIVMSHKARDILTDVYGVPEERAVYIPHGIPDMPFGRADRCRQRLELTAHRIIFSFGLLSPGKGIEHMIEAMPEIVRHHPDVMYVVLGETHPHVKTAHGDEYRQSLLQKVRTLGLEDYVQFRNRFVELDLLCEYLMSVDVFVTPYLSPDQITSGTLAYALGMGVAVVSTPYWYAEELLADGRGRLVPFRDSSALAHTVNEILSDDDARQTMRRKGYEHCRSMTWSAVGKSYIKLADEVFHHGLKAPKQRLSLKRRGQILEELPEINLQHLHVMTDDTGILQHATYSTPNRAHGYCVDDNARALIVVSKYYALRKDKSVIPLFQVYLGFLLDAFNAENGRFRNFMSYERVWLEAVGSEDSHGRALWGLGFCGAHAPNRAIRDMATQLLMDGLPAVVQFTSPRAWAFALIGLHAYLEVFGGDTAALRIRTELAEKLQEEFDTHAHADWPWIEDVVTYANAKLPHALLLAGQWIPDSRMFETAVTALNWLLSMQTTPEGHISVIGNRGWMKRDGERAAFDQQPIDVMGLIEACAEAFRATSDRNWLRASYRCLAWFLGRNDLNVNVCDLTSGGCCDGLQPHGLNTNQGAESTLAWLISLLALYEMVGLEVLIERRGAADPGVRRT